MTSIDVRPIDPESTWSLRQSVLRPHQAIHEMEWPHDRAAEALHFGAFVDGALVGIASVVPEPPPEGGDAGGRVVVEGTPEEVVASGSHTGVALKSVLARVA